MKGKLKIIAGSTLYVATLLLPALVTMHRGDLLPIVSIAGGISSGLVMLHGVQDVFFRNRL